MIGLVPHEMTTGLWAFSAGLAVVLALPAALSAYVAVRLALGDRDETRRS